MQFNGTYDEYSDYVRTPEYEKIITKTDENLQNKAPDHQDSEVKESWIQSKEEKARRRKNEQILSSAEDEISKMESRLADIDSELEKDSVSCDYTLLETLITERESIKRRIDELYVIWDTAHTALIDLDKHTS